ncbi:hypothetical protein [Pseudofulvibacter geojedonensis]|uniref:Uncharacterized protein n=1 Tax=Pseudofulvibacter geojedonensis TaxID=1123758 RepID=A0ABW3I1N2_9FLAO
MKKTLLFICFLITVSFASSQECNYPEEYYSLVASARKKVKIEKFKEAEKDFKEAFSLTDFPLGDDLGYALYVAQKRKNANWAKEIAIQLARGGVPLRYFVKYKRFKWFNGFKSNFKKYKDYYHENFNEGLKIRYKKLLKDDVVYNERYHQWRTREIEIPLNELVSKASEIVSEFKSITDKYGFPTERLMGYNYVYKKNAIERFYSGVLVVHIYQRGVLVFQNEIGKIVCNGSLHPNMIKTLKMIRGYGDSTGVEQEMKVRHKIFRKELYEE